MQLELSNEERAIIEELLTKESKELPVEIHHTRTNDFKDHLKNKQKIVDGILKRVQQ